MLTHLRKTLLTGIVVLVPIVVTFKVMEILFRFTDGILGNALSKLLDIRIPGLGLLLFLILVYISGLAYRSFFGKGVLKWAESVIEKIPLARTIYTGVKQLLGPFLGESGPKSLGRSVLVEYPAPGIYTYGFLVKEHASAAGQKDLAHVFVASNHLHLGVVILVERKSIVEIDVPFEDMIKLMASCGAAAPDIRMLAKPPSRP